MDVKTVEERWNAIGDKLKKKYPVLKDEDVKYQPANEEAMLKNLEIKTGLSRPSLISLLNTLE